METYIDDLRNLGLAAAHSWDEKTRSAFGQKLASILSDSKKKNEILDMLYDNYWIPDLIKKWESLIEKEKYTYFYNYINKNIKINIEKNIEKIVKWEYVGEVDYYVSIMKEMLNLLEIFEKSNQRCNYIEIFRNQDLWRLSLGVSELLLIFYEDWEKFFEEFSKRRKQCAMKIKLKDLDLDENADITDVAKNLFDKYVRINAQVNYRGKTLYTYRINSREDILKQYDWKQYLDIPKLKSNLLSNLMEK